MASSQPTFSPNSRRATQQPQHGTIERQQFYPDPKSLVKSCETLSFLVRDAAHITPDNFTLCVGTIRSFVEASTMKARLQQLQVQPGNKKREARKVASSKAFQSQNLSLHQSLPLPMTLTKVIMKTKRQLLSTFRIRFTNLIWNSL